MNLLCFEPRSAVRHWTWRGRQFWHAPRALKGLLLRLPMLIGGLRLMLRVLPFRQVLRLVERGANPRSARRRDPLPPETVARAVRLVGRRLLPERPCLTLALVGLLLLRRRGYEAHLRIGVKTDSNGELCAHAWVEGDGHVLIGQLIDLESFAVLPSVIDPVVRRLA